MQEPLWVGRRTALALHDRQLAEHGGLPGIRDTGMLESALARPQNLFLYSDDTVNVPTVAAAYAYGVASNHPFIDGNKRTAMVVSFLFSEKNGYTVTASEEVACQTFLKLATGDLTEDALAAWFGNNTKKR